jgi:diacylglycerol kinase (ATP)
MRQLIDSFNCAIEGFIYVLRTQMNMRFHFLLGVLIVLAGIILDFSRIELICLGGIVTMVLFAEMVNTALEHTIDLISDTFHPLARIIKDISAGAVLLTAVSATIFGYLLFSRHLEFSIVRGLGRLKESPAHITIIALMLVLALVILGKAMFHKGTPLRGGMPSGHSALAFSVWTIIVFSTSNPLIIILSFLMAFAIARSRLSQGIHTVWEIAAGAVLGFLITLLVFQIFR